MQTPSSHISLKERLKSCDLCPRQCHIDRTKTGGFCKISNRPAIYQNFIHIGEECHIIPAMIINMCGCNLQCPACPERHRWDKRLNVDNPEHYAHALAEYFKRHPEIKSLEWIGGEPSIQLDFILDTLKILRDLGDLPTVYLNSNMYFSHDLLYEMIGLRDGHGKGLIDAFVFDLKCTQACGMSVTGRADYYETVIKNISKAADLLPKAPHIMRHLVMPGHLACCTQKIIQWCKDHIPQVTFNLMTGFHDFREDAAITDLSDDERRHAIRMAEEAGFEQWMIDGEWASKS